MIKARKITYRIIQQSNVRAQDLDTIIATRKMNNRESGQYKLESSNKTIQFKNFNELKFYNNQVLRNKHKHVILTRENKIANVNIASYPPGKC